MRPRRSDKPAEKVTVYLNPDVLDDMQAHSDGLSLGAMVERLWERRDRAMVVMDDRPVYSKPSAAQPAHVCTSWRLNAIGKNVCADESCQKPKHR